MIDLHLHTARSDGTWEPDFVVAMAKKHGFSAIAITDHDAISGIEPAMEEGKKLGVEVVPGLELTTMFRGVETHVLGYYIMYKEPELSRILEDIALLRIERVGEMIDLLKKNKGFEIELDRVVALAGNGRVGRPHIANELANRGYIDSRRDAFTDELIGNNAKCYRPVCDLTVEEAVSILLDFGGTPVIAHPGFWRGVGDCIPDEDIEGFIKHGLEGIECRHHRHTQKISEHFERLAEKLGLLKTGGSDCHGTYYDPIKIGTVVVPDVWLDEMKARRAIKGKTASPPE